MTMANIQSINSYIQLSVIPDDRAFKVHSVAHAAYEEHGDIDKIDAEIIAGLKKIFPNGDGEIYIVERSDDGETIGIHLPFIAEDHGDNANADDDMYIVITSRT